MNEPSDENGGERQPNPLGDGVFPTWISATFLAIFGIAPLAASLSTVGLTVWLGVSLQVALSIALAVHVLSAYIVARASRDRYYAEWQRWIGMKQGNQHANT